MKKNWVSINKNSPRRSEIIKTLQYIYAHLRNNEEAIFWAKEYLKLHPKNIGMLTILAFTYFEENVYPEFLEIAEKIHQIFGYDMIIRHKLLEYFINIDVDLSKALEIIDDAEKAISLNQNIMKFYPDILFYKSKVYFLNNDLEISLQYAESAWFEYGNRETKLYLLIVDLYKKLEEWEQMEDFCLNTFYQNEQNPDLYPPLYFAHIKRHSDRKAQLLYEQAERRFPDLIPTLEDIKNKEETKNSNIIQT